jgi:hypothetical protein
MDPIGRSTKESPVKHRFRMEKDPSQPNLRQVYLIHEELFEDVRGAGFEVTGLRNPCAQIDTFQKGLMKQVVGRDADGRVRFKSGIMSVVLSGGVVRPGDPVKVVLPDGPHLPLEIV